MRTKFQIIFNIQPMFILFVLFKPPIKLHFDMNISEISDYPSVFF